MQLATKRREEDFAGVAGYFLAVFLAVRDLLDRLVFVRTGFTGVAVARAIALAKRDFLRAALFG